MKPFLFSRPPADIGALLSRLYNSTLTERIPDDIRRLLEQLR